MTPQVKRIIGFIVIVIGIHISNCRELHDSEEETVSKDINDKHHNSTSHNESSESVETLEEKEGDQRKQSERKPNKREQRTIGQLYPLANQKPIRKPKPKAKTIEAPYPQKDSYPKEEFFSNNHGNELINPGFVSSPRTKPLVASAIDIRRAVAFENDYINRHYLSKLRHPPATLTPGVTNGSPQVISLPLNQPKPNDYHDPDGPFVPNFSPLEMYHPLSQIHRLHLQNYQQFSPSVLQQPSFLPNSADELNRFRNPDLLPQVEPTQNFVPSSSVENDGSRFVEPPEFVPWIPQGYKNLQQFSPLNRYDPRLFPSARPPSEGYNMEVSEIGEPAFIVPENVGKVEIVIPPPFAPLRTYGLSINDAQITRNEVRKDNGEFLSSYTTSDGTERLDSGSLVPTPDGDQVLVLKGSYTFSTPEGLRFRVDYMGDETGYHATQVPISEKPKGS